MSMAFAGTVLYMRNAGAFSGHREPFFTSDIKYISKCQCSNPITSLTFINPVFGSKCIINDINSKTDAEVIHILKQMDELKQIRGDLICLHYICNLIRDKNNKNKQRLSIFYCKYCENLINSNYKVYYKFCGLTYYKKNVHSFIDYI